MRRDTRITKPLTSSFLSCEKDAATILKKLFVESYPYSEKLIRLLVINTEDCLENNTDTVKQILQDMTLSKITKEGYVRFEPKVRMEEHAEVKSYIIISFDSFTPTKTNSPFYRDCTINFDIICHIDKWDIGDYRLRPLKIAGYIDGLLNECKLSGIGTLNFIGCSTLILNEDLAGYSLSYRAVHGNDDQIPPQED